MLNPCDPFSFPLLSPQTRGDRDDQTANRETFGDNSDMRGKTRGSCNNAVSFGVILLFSTTRDHCDYHREGNAVEMVGTW